VFGGQNTECLELNHYLIPYQQISYVMLGKSLPAEPNLQPRLGYKRYTLLCKQSLQGFLINLLQKPRPQFIIHIKSTPHQSVAVWLVSSIPIPQISIHQCTSVVNKNAQPELRDTKKCTLYICSK